MSELMPVFRSSCARRRHWFRARDLSPLAVGGRLRVHQFGRVAHELGGAPPARNFQNALVVGAHDIIIADTDDGIVGHLASPKVFAPDRRHVPRIVPPRNR